MGKLFFAIASAASLACSGCALQPLTQRAAEAEDQALVAATWTLCRAISVGAWLRAYSQSPEKARAWRTLCSEPVGEVPVSR